MKRSDLYKALAVTAEMTGTAQLNEATLRLMADRLEHCPEQSITAALQRCQMELQAPLRPLTLVSILERLEEGHLGPEEAWALVASLDEGGSVVWTDEIAEAYGVALGVLPDRVGARMAFLEVYRRLVAQARQEGRPATWWASLGWDVTGRVGPVVDAVARGHLPQRVAMDALPPAAWPTKWQRALVGDREAPLELPRP